MDREKVKKGLEYHLKELTVGKTCYECPYCGDNPCEIQLIANALALLQEQEAVEPYITGNGESFETAETWWYECGNCNKPIDPNDKFCRHCGQAVKWE